MDYMTVEHYIAELKNNWKLILLFTGGGFILAAFYCLVLFKPTYICNAKILIQDVQPTNLVTDLGGERHLTTGGSDKNAVLTQMEILTSGDLAKQVEQSLVQDKVFPSTANPQDIVSRIQKSIKLKNPTATDIIELRVAWNDAQKAYKITQAILSNFYDSNVALNKHSVTQTKAYIQRQLQESQLALDKTREEIKNYRQSKDSIDLTSEADSMTKQIADTENNISDLQSRIHYNQGKVKALSGRLHINPAQIQNSLNQVALGQNDNLSALNQNLNQAEEEYASLENRYPSGTKKMGSLQENMDKIKNQIQQQVSNTIGKQGKNDGQTIIKDSVRTQMVDDMVNSQAEAASLLAQQRSLQEHLGGLKTQEKSMPAEQKTLVALQEKEENLASIVNTLTTKGVEANVRESEIASNINVIESPVLPSKPGLPTRFQLMLLITLTGFLSGCLVIIAQYYNKNTAKDLHEVENLLNAPVLGNLTWLTPTVYNAKNSLRHDDVALDYQKLVTAFRVQQENKAFRAVGFSNLTGGEGRPIIVQNIAKQLAKSDYSVLIIDANFRRKKSSPKFEPASNQKMPDLKDLLHGKSHPGWDVEQFLIPLTGEKSIYLLQSSESNDNAYELANSKSFPLLIERIKEKFDFILVDMPELLEVPDSIVLSRALDGLVPICGLHTNRDDLSKARKICTDNRLNLIGSITKNLN